MNRGISIGALAVLACFACSGGARPPAAAPPGSSTDQTSVMGGPAATTPSMQSASGTSNKTDPNAPAMMATATQPGAAGSGAAASPATDPAMNTPTDTQSCPSCPIPASCLGFKLEGLKYSPGGSMLPNKCMPFDATTNNPYAVRCIDAIPGFKTQFAGDHLCILPPPPDQGMQIGLHPQGNSATYWKQIWAGDLSGYASPPTEWVLKPGDEITQNYRSRDATNTMPMNYYRTYFRMRTGSHHMIVTMHDSTDPDGWIPGQGEALPGLFDPASGAVQGVLGGEQRPDDNTPATLEKPMEDDGLYLVYPVSPTIIFNMHHFNITDAPLLREGWINIWWESDARTPMSWYMGMEPTQTFSLNVTPGTTADLHYSWAIGGDMRLIRVFGHRHFWTTNFSTWIKRASGDTELAYQSYDWFNMPTYRYDSQAKNPPLAPDTATDGAMSGIVMLHAGDTLHFNCHVEYTDARQAADSHAQSPEKIGALRFANEAYTGEMCIQYGNVTGGSLGLPGIDSTAVPDFAKRTAK